MSLGRFKNEVGNALLNAPSALFSAIKNVREGAKNTAVVINQVHHQFDEKYMAARRKAWVSKVADPNTFTHNLLNGAGYGLQFGLTIGAVGLFLFYAGDYALAQAFSNDPNAQVTRDAASFGIWNKAAEFVAASTIVGAAWEGSEPLDPPPLDKTRKKPF